jgi:hypothetical protein
MKVDTSAASISLDTSTIPTPNNPAANSQLYNFAFIPNLMIK